MEPSKLLLLDVGGTFIKCSDGREIPVDSDASVETVRLAFREAVGDFCRERESDRDHAGEFSGGIAVAMPGPFDYGKGIFLMKHKFASVYGEDFRTLAGVPSCIDLRFTHDVNGMLSGEMAYGNGRGWSRVALVTLGTGLGFSMCIDGEILKNETGSPRISIFRLPFRDGILEDYASKRGFLSFYASKGGVAATVRQIAEFAVEGDSAAKETFSETGIVIASAIRDILTEYEIECLLFGGQISRSFFLMEDSLKSGLSSVKCLKRICPVSDFDNATFNGLRSLFG